MVICRINVPLFSLAMVFCTAFIFAGSIAREPAKIAPCGKVEDEVRSQCMQMQENQWYDGGAVEYTRREHIKDIPRCDNLASNIFQICSRAD